MTRKPSATGFNKLLATDVTLLSRDRLLGLLELDTDTGPISLVMNKLIAERLMETLIDFLQAGEGDDAPSFAVELLEFGPLSHFLSGMKYPDLMAISASYGGLRPHLIKSWVRALCGIRNVCAHHSRFWNRPLVDQPSLPRAQEVPHLDHLLGDPDSNKRLYAALAIMQTLLKTVNPRTKWADRLKAHVATFPQSPHITIASAGFPPNWQALPLWN
ncbi:Abi family protein [Mesorhizobium sp. AR07]|uniref:Abi family protein n=1 Tax=Mesorhizobium sp. AR07 TaxID=2865838 RepID=UPI0021602C4C|nr:Abi family protein [Mesorhizobium sp. AR07]UVK43253.1 Abi family protein [Mesorhizobium sp. AR07]